MKNILDKVFSKSERRALVIGATILMLAINSLSFSQIKINNVREGYYVLYDADSIKFDNKATELEAQQGLLNYQLRTGKKGYWDPPSYRIDITGNNIIEPIEMKAIDTINILAHNYGNNRSVLKAVLDDCNKIYVTSKDSLLNIPSYTFSAKLERIKSWPEAETTYKLIDLPFYFYKSDSVYKTTEPTTMKVRTFANKIHCIRHFVNGVEIIGHDLYNTIACNPGNSDYAGGSFRHSNTFYNLDRSIDNVIRLEAIDIDTSDIIGSRELIIKALE